MEKNDGQGNARNLAINLSTGKYIMFLDPDDWYEPETLEKLYNQIEKYDNDLVFFGMYLYDVCKYMCVATYT